MRRFGRQAVLTVAEVVAPFADFATLKTLSAWLMVSPPPMWIRCGMGGGYMMGHDSVAVWIGGIAPTVEAWDRVWKSSTIIATTAAQKWFWRTKT